MSYRYSAIDHAVTSKAPGDDRSRGENNKWIVIDDKKVTRVTWPNKGHGGNVSVGTENSIRKQLKLDKPNFARFVECPMDRNEYIEFLRQKIRNNQL